MPSKIESAAHILSRIDGMRDSLTEQRDSAQERAEENEERAAVLDQTLAVLRGLEAEYREHFAGTLSDIVSHAVSSVFGEDIRVRLETATFRGTTSMEIVVEQDGMETGILSAKGGSLVQVCAFSMRVVVLLTAGRQLMPLLVLDEPFAMVSAEYRPQVAELIRELADKAQMQFLIITHEPELVEAADVAYEVDKPTSKSAVLRLIKQAEEARL